jgi:tetratricopeptide (TPR) repeat protein
MDIKASESEMLRYLKERNDLLAAQKAEVVLSVQPGNICALWAKAEIYRRAYDFNESKKILNRILAASPGYPPALITLAYIDYHDNRFREALSLLKQALNSAQLGREDKAIAYMLIGSVNAKRAKQGGLFNKIAYGTRILGYFEKARAFAPGLAEVRLGLGSFYLLAPRIAGGNIDLAIEELKRAVDLAPDFATANARLAQAYREKGDMDKYNFYISRAKKLDPANEVVVELEGRI